MRDNLLTAITRRKDSPPTVAEPGVHAPALRTEASVRLADGGRRGVDQEADPRRPARLLRQVLPPQQRGAARRGRHDRGGAARQAGGGVREVEARRAPPPRSCPRPRAPRPTTQHLPDRQGRRAAVVDSRRPDRHRPQEPRLLPRHGHEPDPGRRLLPPGPQPARGQGLDVRRALELSTAGARPGRSRRAASSSRRTRADSVGGDPERGERACATPTSPTPSWRAPRTRSSSRSRPASPPARTSRRSWPSWRCSACPTATSPNTRRRSRPSRKDDVRRVARKYLDPNHLTIVVVGDRKTLAEPLAKLAPVENRDLDGNPLPGGP